MSEEWLKKLFEPPPQKPKGAFTITEIIEKTGIKRTLLENRLRGEVERGNLIKGKCVINGKTSNYYLPVKKKKK